MVMVMVSLGVAVILGEGRASDYFFLFGRSSLSVDVLRDGFAADGRRLKKERRCHLCTSSPWHSDFFSLVFRLIISTGELSP